jgi:Flp pilus assembly protein TadD
VTSDILRVRPKNIEMLELNAICYEQVGLKNEAVQRYQSLYMITDDMNVLYRMAVLQYELKRYSESKTSAELLIESKGADKKLLQFPSGETVQEVSLQAAGYNLLGMIAGERGNKEQARTHFLKALSMYPEFAIAKENLAALD